MQIKLLLNQCNDTLSNETGQCSAFIDKLIHIVQDNSSTLKSIVFPIFSNLGLHYKQLL